MDKPILPRHLGEPDPAGERGRVLLADLQPGEAATVCELMGGRMMQARLAALGFTPGAPLSVVQNYGRGPLMVSVRGTRVALGRGEAGKISVERGPGE
jgi:ferrous iron transport protein A